MTHRTVTPDTHRRKTSGAEIEARYKQTVFGGPWAIIQPFFSMVLFSLIFRPLAKIPSDGLPSDDRMGGGQMERQ